MPHSPAQTSTPTPGPRRPVLAPSRLRRTARTRSVAVALAILAVGAGTAGCTPTINVPAGEDAGNPLCARTVLMVPTEVGGLPKVKASSQATAAWGAAGAAITLRCGVAQPAVGVGNCQEIIVRVGGVDTAFDWITSSDENGWTFTTYGRDPAVSVQVPASIEGQSTAPLVDLAPAVNEIPVTKRCV